jgi:NAD-dependent dihydropyrimidine dehydrogenase PreA subunit
LGWQGNKAALVHPDLCTYCTLCEDACPVNAIELPYLVVMGASKEMQNEQRN